MSMPFFENFAPPLTQNQLRHCINPLKEHPERIKKNWQKIAEKLDYDGIVFPVQEKDFSKIEVKNHMH